MTERDDILQKIQVLRIHARGASKAEKARLDRDYQALHARLQDIEARCLERLREALEKSRDAIKAVYLEIDNPSMPANLAAAWETADRILGDVGGEKL